MGRYYNSTESGCGPGFQEGPSPTRYQDIELLSVDCEGVDLDVLESLDWTRVRPTAIIIEDFEQFTLNAAQQVSPIRAYLAERNYALAAQAIFSFIYVDRTAFAKVGQEFGFRLDQSQLGAAWGLLGANNPG